MTASVMRTCRECGLEFQIAESEQAHLKATFGRLVLPSRCKPCRRFRRDERAAQRQEASS